MTIGLYKLMIKTHSVTGLKYLCITMRKKWERYSGSGVQWLKHLRKHGREFTTELLFSSNDYDEFQKKCVEYSEKFDVVRSKEFANQIPETGYGEDGRPIVVGWWENASTEMIEDVFKRRAKTLKQTWDDLTEERRSDWVSNQREGWENWWNSLDGSTKQRYYENRCYLTSKAWESIPLDVRRKMTEHIRSKSAEFFANRDSERYKEFVELKRRQTAERFASMDEEEITEYGKKVTDGKLSVTPEDREAWKERFKATWEANKERHLARCQKMSEERIGFDNPNCKRILWHGETYIVKDFNKKFGHYRSKKNQAMFDTRADCAILFEQTKEHLTLTCPHCGASTNKSPTAFLRWHFQNCKERKTVKIEKIEQVEEFDIYDISVEDHHCFALENGVIAHNSMYPRDVVSGGTGGTYSSNDIWIISRSQEKEGTELAGYTFTINIEKSRRVKEKSKIPLTVMFDGGITRYSGLLDLALEAGMVIKPSMGWYQKVDPETGEVLEGKYRMKDTNTAEFWEPLLKSKEFNDAIRQKFLLVHDAQNEEVSDDE